MSYNRKRRRHGERRRKVAWCAQKPSRTDGNDEVCEKIRRVRAAKSFDRKKHEHQRQRLRKQIRQPQAEKVDAVAGSAVYGVFGLIRSGIEEPAELLIPMLTLILHELERISRDRVIYKAVRRKAERNDEHAQVVFQFCPALHELEHHRHYKHHAKRACKRCICAEQTSRQHFAPPHEVHAAERTQQKQALAHGCGKEEHRRRKAQKFDRPQRRLVPAVERNELIKHDIRSGKAQRRHDKSGDKPVACHRRDEPHSDGIARQENELHKSVDAALRQVPVTGDIEVMPAVGACPEIECVKKAVGAAEDTAQDVDDNDDEHIP